MGLLDNLGNLSPEQTQGLLGFASQMLQAGGPSRMPVGFGQALGAGLQGYQGATDAARRQKLEEEQAKQIAEMRAMQIQSLGGELQDKETARKQALDAQKWMRDFNAQRNSPTARAQSILGNNLAPTLDNAAALSAAQPQSSGAQADGGIGNTMSQFNSRMAQAQAMRGSGNPSLMAAADTLEKSALEFRPKVKNWEKVNVGGRTLLKPYFEDGTAGDPVTADVAEKLQFQNLGNKTVGLNPFTGQQVSAYNNTMSPDAVASNSLARERFNFDKQQAAAPQYMETDGGIVALPKHQAQGVAPTGVLVNGADGQPLQKKQNIPQYVVQAVSGNAKSLASIDAAIESLKSNDGKDAVGWKGYLPNSMLNRVYPDGTKTRADIADVGSLELHDRSGAAVTASESPRLLPFIPLATDDADTAIKKLTRLKQLTMAETNNLTFAYPGAKKLAEFASQGNQDSPSEPSVPAAGRVRKYNPATGKIE